jgi:hypothetical protein
MSPHSSDPRMMQALGLLLGVNIQTAFKICNMAVEKGQMLHSDYKLNWITGIEQKRDYLCEGGKEFQRL